jgi:cell wall-associated NlpC family hydrolase
MKYPKIKISILLLFALTLLMGCGGKRGRTSPLAADIINTAQMYIGVPYVYGGKSPKGFDCSGLIWYVYRQHGIELPVSSSKQASAGYKISKKEMRPGDLVFFQSRGRVNHVGLYIGDGMMIHAPGSGKKVRKANLSDDYYQKTFATVRRVI